MRKRLTAISAVTLLLILGAFQNCGSDGSISYEGNTEATSSSVSLAGVSLPPGAPPPAFSCDACRPPIDGRSGKAVLNINADFAYPLDLKKIAIEVKSVTQPLNFFWEAPSGTQVSSMLTFDLNALPLGPVMLKVSAETYDPIKNIVRIFEGSLSTSITANETLVLSIQMIEIGQL